MGDSGETPFSSTIIVDPTQILSDAEIRKEDLVLGDLFFANFLDCMKWLAKRKLLKNSYLCFNCNIPMRLRRNARARDGYQWFCKICIKGRTIRSDSLFSRSHLELQQILLLMHGWSFKIPLHYIVKTAEIGRGYHTVIEWYKFCSDLCENYFILHEITIRNLNGDNSSNRVEMVWRNQFPDSQTFQELLLCIAAQYPL